MPKVFLGGTKDSKWREELIQMLKIDYFNPVVPDWTQECMKEEIEQRGVCDYGLYVITPKMTGVYSIAEAVDDSNKRPGRTVFCFLIVDGKKEFTEGQVRSLRAVSDLIVLNGGHSFFSLKTVAEFLNNSALKKEER